MMIPEEMTGHRSNPVASEEIRKQVDDGMFISLTLIQYDKRIGF